MNKPNRREETPDPVEDALHRSASRVNPDPNFVDRLAARLRRSRKSEPAPRPRFRLPWPVWAGAAVALTLIIVFVVQALWPAPSAPVTPNQSQIAEGPGATPGPEATPEPKPPFADDLPPAVATTVPRPGEEVTPQAGILVRFTQPMDRESVEQALRVTPGVEGEFIWQDDTTVTFTPKVLAAGTRYEVEVGTEALARNGRPLTSDLAFTFSTVGPLTVTHTTPRRNAIKLRADTPVVLAFNYPLVPINCTGAVADESAGCPPLPLEIAPGAVGQGMWVNTSVYRFDPVPAWDAGEHYTVTLPAGVEAVGGARLDQPVVWGFSTAPPEVRDVRPSQNATYVPLETGVRVTFNTPMDAESTEAAFSLVAAGGETVPGSYTWEENNATLVFTPTENLALNTIYIVRLSEEARAVNGAPIAAGLEQRFTTTPPVAVLRIYRSNSDRTGRVLDFFHESVLVDFAGLVDHETVAERVRVTQDGEEVESNVWWRDFGPPASIAVGWEKEPGLEYCVTVEPGIADRYGNITTEERSACFIAGDMPPVFAPATRMNFVSVDAATAAHLYFVSVNVSYANFTLSRLPEQGFTGYDAYSGETLRSWTLNVAGGRNDALVSRVDLAEGAALPTGYYIVNWNAPELEYQQSSWIGMAVVDRHLTLKVSDDEALVWVTDLRSGTPIAGAPVRLLDDNGAELGSGVSDADGIARFPIPQQERWNTYLAVSGTPGQPGFGAARSGWNAGVSPWEFDISTDYGTPARYQAYLHTDRPIYRPGQTVHLRGILRTDDDARYGLPEAGTEVLISVRNWDNTIAEFSAETTAMGTFTGTVAIPADATLGAYNVTAELPGDDQASWSLGFTVAAYRKPEFEVAVTPPESDVLSGAELRVPVEARYYAGGPVSNARVHWVLRAKPYAFSPDVPGWWDWRSTTRWWAWWREPEVIAEGDATTDAQGRVILELPSELKPLEDDEEANSQSWTIEATVTDESGFPVTGRGEVTVHETNFYLGLKPRTWVVQAGEEAAIDLLALDWYAEPVAGQTVEVSLARRNWTMVPATEPFASPTWNYTDTVVSTVEVATDGSGAAEVELTPPSSGSYVVVVEGADGPRTVRSETHLWVAGPQAAAWKNPEGQIQPIADAQSYRPGETAQILLPTPFEAPYEVLVSVERGGILDVWRFTAEEANPLVAVPIAEGYVPNVVVSFVAVKGAEGPDDAPDVRIGMVDLEVEPVRQLLTVEVTHDRESYEPGEPVELVVRTLDAAGNPADAEVALAVVDKAVLALADPNAPTLREGFYAPRSLGVLTGDSLIALFSRMASELEEVAEQDADRLAKEALYGGIGGGGGGAEQMIDVRREYPDIAFWEARLRTGDDGEARVRFDLPDSLTTWVADARAVTGETQVGQTTAEFVVTKPLLVRPVTPRFFTAGDRAEVAAVVHNNTESDVTAEVSLEALGVELESDASQSVTLPAQGKVRVAWEVTVPTGGSDAALLTFVAEGGGYRDAARPNVGRESDRALPIYRYETPDVFGTAGTLGEAGSRMEALVVPPQAGPASELTLRIEPTLAAGMTEALSYLEHYPHESTESIVSRFLPNVVTYLALQELELVDPELEAALQLQVADALDRLYSRQRVDGGWGWWQGEQSSFQVSAYAVLGLIEAQRAGFPIRERALNDGLNYLENKLEAVWRAEAYSLPEAFALYVLAEGERSWPEETGNAFFAARHRFGVTGHAYLALAFGIADPDDSRVTTLLEDLRAEAEYTASGAHWEDSDARHWVTWTRATSVVLDAMVRLAPDDPLLPQAVRWLMVARRADRWETTQETAWAVIALSDYMAATGELDSDYAWGAALNTEPLGKGQVTPENLREPVEFTVPVEELLREWPNALEISRGEGEGNLYYAAHLTLYRPVEEVEAENRGITVQRQYCAVTETPETLAWDEAMGNCTPISEAQPGELVEVRLTLTLPRMRNYLVLEDTYPAGMEPVDPTLETEVQEGVEPGEQSSRRSWWWWPRFDHEELRDERAVFYASQLGSGTYQVRYYLRAAIPGEYRVLPTTAWEMYFPEVRGRSDGAIFRVVP